jgi:hypothetical protein
VSVRVFTELSSSGMWYCIIAQNKYSLLYKWFVNWSGDMSIATSLCTVLWELVPGLCKDWINKHREDYWSWPIILKRNLGIFCVWSIDWKKYS